MVCTFDHALCIVFRHFLIGISWCRGCYRFFDVHQGQFLLFSCPDAAQDNHAQLSERTATFHPVGRIKNLDFRIIVAGAERGREVAQGSAREELFRSLGRGQWPES